MEKEFEEVKAEKEMSRHKNIANLVILQSLYPNSGFRKDEKENVKDPSRLSSEGEFFGWVWVTEEKD